MATGAQEAWPQEHKRRGHRSTRGVATGAQEAWPQEHKRRGHRSTRGVASRLATRCNEPKSKVVAMVPVWSPKHDPGTLQCKGSSHEAPS